MGQLCLFMESFLCSLTKIRFSAASLASPSSCAYVVGIRCVIGMALRTMSLSGITCGNSVSAEQIRLVSRALQVIRSYAASIPAKVVDGQTWRNRTLCQFITHAMRWHWPGVGEREVPITSSGVNGALPFPAAVGFLHFVPKAFGHRPDWLQLVGAIALHPFPVKQAYPTAMSGPITDVNGAEAFLSWHLSKTILARGALS